MKILLLDLDGVLLEPRAYHLALQETVFLVGRSLGYGSARPKHEDIQVFEAVGVTSEWDSAAICSALLLRHAWKTSPDLDLPSEPPLTEASRQDLQVPDYKAFFLSPKMSENPSTPGLIRALRALVSEALSENQVRALTELLCGARSIHASLTHRLFQELVLGSALFQVTYGLKPCLDSPGYLSTYDRPALSVKERRHLLDWLSHPNHQAAVFTNRPSKTPSDDSSPPEAEIGLKLLGMANLPVIGQGGLAWLARELDADPDSLLKPSSVHTLAALRRTVGTTLEESLWASAALAFQGESDSQWETLNGATIYVVEDSIKGLYSAQAAQEVLRRVGIHTQLQQHGVSANPLKGKALSAAGAHVFPDLTSALSPILLSG